MIKGITIPDNSEGRTTHLFANKGAEVGLQAEKGRNEVKKGNLL